MSLKFKPNVVIVGRDIEHYVFRKVTGTFLLDVLNGDINFEVLIDGIKVEGPLLIANDQDIILVPLSIGVYVFKLAQSAVLIPGDQLIQLRPGTYYSIDELDCNFKLDIRSQDSMHVYLKCGNRVLVDTSTSNCLIEWSNISKSVIRIDSQNNNFIEVELTKYG